MPANEEAMDKLKIDSDNSDDEEEAGEDERISTLYAFADKHTPKEYVTKLDELGTAGAIVLGGMCTAAETARMHFVVMSLLDADEDTTLAACIDEKRAFLKAACAGGVEGRFAAFLAALESFVLHLDEEEGCREANVEAFDQSLRVCWEYVCRRSNSVASSSHFARSPRLRCGSH